MSLFIPQLLIISALGLMVQTAPISFTKRSTETNSETRLYCASRALHNARGNLSSVKYNDDNSTAKTVLGHFSALCKSYTKAMTLKHQLLDGIFKANIVPGLNSNTSKNYSTILTSLETIANTLNDIEFCKNNSTCVELTPTQYKIMYAALYTNEVLHSLQDMNIWFLNIEEWYQNNNLGTPMANKMSC